MEASLAHFNRAKKEIALARSIDEVKDIRDRAEAMRLYARQVKESLEMQNHLAEIKIRAERRVGEMLKEQEKNPGGRPPENRSHDATSKPPKLEDLGISKSQSSRWQQEASVPEEVFEKHVAEVKDKGEELTSSGVLKLADKLENKPHVSRSSAFNEWYTRAKYIEAARVVMGSIDLDPATSEEANVVVKASNIFTIDDDGLEQRWSGNVWLNPPYSSEFIGKFVDKLVEEVSSGSVRSAIVLVNNATETRWFQYLMSVAAAVCFPLGRIRYWMPGVDTKGSPLQGQAFIYIGPNRDKFEKIFSIHGVVLYA